MTGAAGFLGIHVLAYLLEHTKMHIVCLYHNRNIQEIYELYNMPVCFDENRVSLVHGSLNNEKLGLSDEDYEFVETVDSIINCAALVKYFGDEGDFQKNNVNSVIFLAEFALKHNIILNHISTLSILVTESNVKVTEKIF